MFATFVKRSRIIHRMSFHIMHVQSNILPLSQCKMDLQFTIEWIRQNTQIVACSIVFGNICTSCRACELQCHRRRWLTCSRGILFYYYVLINIPNLFSLQMRVLYQKKKNPHLHTGNTIRLSFHDNTHFFEQLRTVGEGNACHSPKFAVPIV